MRIQEVGLTPGQVKRSQPIWPSEACPRTNRVLARRRPGREDPTPQTPPIVRHHERDRCDGFASMAECDSCPKTDRSESGSRTRKIDPKRALKIGPVNGWEAQESGLWLKAWVAPQADGGARARCFRIGPAILGDLVVGQRIERDRRALHDENSVVLPCRSDPGVCHARGRGGDRPIQCRQASPWSSVGPDEQPVHFKVGIGGRFVAPEGRLIEDACQQRSTSDSAVAVRMHADDDTIPK